jgi:DNA-binding beta-propeller fold protein YncE
LLICDYGSGEILKFSRDGKALGKLATGLKGPAAIVFSQKFAPVGNTNTRSLVPAIYVSERKANRVVEIDSAGKITPMGTEIPEPLGLANGPGGLTVVSHTTSKVYRWGNSIPMLGDIPFVNGLFANRPTAMPEASQWRPVYSAPSADGERYGFRWLVSDGGAFFMSDEDGERILMLTQNGRVATFATGISDPSGVLVGPNGTVYVANEGDGGQLIRLNAEGEKTIVADGLGRPRGMIFVDAKTLLVSNRDGNVWKIALP